jgi:hypothetical protein
MRRLAWVLLLLLGLAVTAWTPWAGPRLPQAQTTPVIPTVTGTATGPVVVAVEQVNVRSGPGTDYDRVGVLLAGQRVAALGRSPGGDWIEIGYPGVPGNVGWVYAYNVTLESAPGLLSIVEPPPTPTVRATATIDSTLAAQFPSLGEAPATRLPTFTVAPPVVQPTLTAQETPGGFPPILAILGLLVAGTFGMLFSLLRRG